MLKAVSKKISKMMRERAILETKRFEKENARKNNKKRREREREREREKALEI